MVSEGGFDAGEDLGVDLGRPMGYVAPRLDVQMPEWALPLLSFDYEYHICYGGRSAGRSYNIGIALLLTGMQRKRKVLCAREHFSNIRESVYSQLVALIDEYRLGYFYAVTKTSIVGKNGTEFLFRGLVHDPESLKSIPGLSDLWIEEAQTITQKSWMTVEPTIRAYPRRIFLSFNPTVESCFVWKTFVRNPPPRSRLYYATYLDNPFISPDIYASAKRMREEDYAAYQNIWLGIPQAALYGAVYSKEIAAIDESRVVNWMIDYSLPVLVSADIGRNDMTALWFIQPDRDGSFLVVDFLEYSNEPWSFYLTAIANSPYTIAHIVLPHDAAHSTAAAEFSIHQQTLQRGFDCSVLPRLSINEGIGFTRELLRRSVFNASTNAINGLERLRSYAWHPKTGHPIHDHNSHAADALRYAATHIAQQHTKQTHTTHHNTYNIITILPT